MAKVNFTKLGLSHKSDEVVTIQYNGQDIEIKQYLGVEEKADLIDTIISKTIADKGFFNPFKLEIMTNFEIVKAYTNITFTEKQCTDNFFKTYDALAADCMKLIFSNIPEDELESVYDAVYEVAEAIMKYNNSLMGVLAQVSANYDNVNFDLEQLSTVLGDPTKLEMVKRMIENV